MGRERLTNEAFLVSSGIYKTVHHKQYFPQEPGWYEREWFARTRSGFDISELRDIRIGALLCTELFFTEWARHYRRLGAHVIAVPRAAGSLNTKWRAAASMTAVVIAQTSASSPLAFVQIDATLVKTAQAAYPCYVAELDEQHVTSVRSATTRPS